MESWSFKLLLYQSKAYKDKASELKHTRKSFLLLSLIIRLLLLRTLQHY